MILVLRDMIVEEVAGEYRPDRVDPTGGMVELSLVDGFLGCCVDDGEALAVECWVGAEDQAAGVRAFEFDEQFGVLAFEAVEDITVDDDDDVTDGVAVFLDDRVEAALDFHGHRHRSFHASAALAVWARFVH